MVKYGLICILEGDIEGDNRRDAQKVMEDALYEAFDSKSAKESNPLMKRMTISIGGSTFTISGKGDT